MTLASSLVPRSAVVETLLSLVPVHLAETVQGLYWRWWLSGHSTTGVSDLKPLNLGGQLVPLVDLLKGLLAALLASGR